MPAYGFGTPPKERVIRKHEELFGSGHDLEVIGTRYRGLEAKTCGKRPGIFEALLLVDGKLTACAEHRDWRKAYRLLEIEVEKIFSGDVQNAHAT